MEQTKRDILKDMSRQIMTIASNIYDMTKELEAMNEKASELKRIVTDELNKNETETQ